MPSRYRRAARAASLLAAVLCPLSAAVAAPLEDFTLIVFEDLDTNSSIEGRAFVGGNLTAGQFGTQLPTPLVFSDTLLVAGDVIAGNVTVDKGDARIGGDVLNGVQLNVQGNSNTNGNVFITGSNFGNINANAQNDTVTLGGTNAGNINNASTLVPNASPAPAAPDIAPIRAELEALSAFAETLTPNSATTTSGNTVTFNVGDPADDLAVFSISGSLFSQQNVQFDLSGLDADEVALINVSGTDIDINQVNFLGSFGQGTLAESRVLFNFFEAATLDITRMTVGALLAPLAHVTNQATLEGSLAAKSFDQRGQVHLETFTGTEVIPEPATSLLMLVGTAAMIRRARGQ